MPALRSTFTVDAPRRLVAGVLRDTVAAAEAVDRAGFAFTAPVRLLVGGDEVRITLRGPAGRLASCRTRITRVDDCGMASELSAGPVVALRHATTLVADGAGTRVVDDLTWTSPLGALGQVADLALRPLARRLLDARAAVIGERAAATGRARVVVGTALVREGRVLAACRSYPPAMAGRWEVPGGSVEPGETEAGAVRRECVEELGTDVVVGERVGTDLPVSETHVLRVHRAEIAPGGPEPEAREHRELRWVAAHELAGLGWLDSDRALVADLRALLEAERVRSAPSPG